MKLRIKSKSCFSANYCNDNNAGMAESSGQRIKKFRFDVVERVDLLSNEEPNVPPLFREELRNIRSCALGKISFRVYLLSLDTTMMACSKKIYLLLGSMLKSTELPRSVPILHCVMLLVSLIL